MTKLQVICSGHISEINHRCRTCRVDAYHNPQCEDYRVIRYGIFPVQGEDNVMKIIDSIEQSPDELETEARRNYCNAMGHT